MVLGKLTIFIILLLSSGCNFGYDETGKLYPPGISCNDYINCLDKTALNACQNQPQSCMVNQVLAAYTSGGCDYQLTGEEEEHLLGCLPEFYQACMEITPEIKDMYAKVEHCLTQSNDQELVIFICMID